MSNITTKEAVETLINSLKTDPGYRESWKANIAMAFIDQYNWATEMNVANKYKHDPAVIHEIANKAADRFLDLLVYNKYEGMPVLPDGSSFFIG